MDAKAENGQGTRDASHGHALSFVAAAAAQASQTTTTKRMLTYPQRGRRQFLAKQEATSPQFQILKIQRAA